MGAEVKGEVGRGVGDGEEKVVGQGRGELGLGMGDVWGEIREFL